MRRLRDGILLATLLALAPAGCGSPGAVALSLFVESPTVSVQDAALGAELSGSFGLALSLGEYAESGVTVQVESFELLDATGTLAGPLALTGAPATVTLAPGGEQTFPVTFRQAALLDAATRARVCDGELRIAGAVSDGARTTSGRSRAVAASCP